MRAGQALSHSVMGFFDRSELHPEEVEMLAEHDCSADEESTAGGQHHDLAKIGADIDGALGLEGIDGGSADQFEHFGSLFRLVQPLQDTLD